jgi:FKBP-type peptidyl-prolyl cis-trans isomerase 2
LNETIENGSKVKLHFTLRVDGDVVQSTEGEEPLSYVQGESRLLPALEEELSGMGEGESKKLELPPDRAYGPRNPEAVRTVAKSSFDDPAAIRVGSRVRGEARGAPFEAVVAEVGSDKVTLDLNHPLAGKTLDFEVTVVGVE